MDLRYVLGNNNEANSVSRRNTFMDQAVLDNELQRRGNNARTGDLNERLGIQRNSLKVSYSPAAAPINLFKDPLEFTDYDISGTPIDLIKSEGLRNAVYTNGRFRQKSIASSVSYFGFQSSYEITSLIWQLVREGSYSCKTRNETTFAINVKVPKQTASYDTYYLEIKPKYIPAEDIGKLWVFGEEGLLSSDLEIRKQASEYIIRDPSLHPMEIVNAYCSSTHTRFEGFEALNKAEVFIRKILTSIAIYRYSGIVTGNQNIDYIVNTTTNAAGKQALLNPTRISIREGEIKSRGWNYDILFRAYIPHERDPIWYAAYNEDVQYEYPDIKLFRSIGITAAGRYRCKYEMECNYRAIDLDDLEYWIYWHWHMRNLRCMVEVPGSTNYDILMDTDSILAKYEELGTEPECVGIKKRLQDNYRTPKMSQEAARKNGLDRLQNRRFLVDDLPDHTMVCESLFADLSDIGEEDSEIEVPEAFY